MMLMDAPQPTAEEIFRFDLNPQFTDQLFLDQAQLAFLPAVFAVFLICALLLAERS